MFYFYGRKKKIVKKYPVPNHKLIIEPFAGSAAYSMEYWDRDVILIEKDKRICDIWEYLQEATKNDILSLPLIEKGRKTTDYELTLPEQDLIGYYIARGASSPNLTPSGYNSWTEKNREKLAGKLHKIKHWSIRCGDYTEIENQEATWFIDPPYVNGGHRYRLSNKMIDYDLLADWCRKREGQVIVCENSDASWLPFKPLVELRGQKHTRHEAIYKKGE